MKIRFNNFLAIGILFAFILSISSVFAYSDLGYYLDQAAYSIQPFAQFFLGGFDYTGYMLFERFLLFLIIFGISFIVLRETPLFNDAKNRNVLIVISLAVPLLAVRYISLEWLNTVIVSYRVFGIAVTSFIPFLIYFFFLIQVARDHPAIRKIGWILFACIYFALYSTAESSEYSQVYMWTAFVAVAFFLLDGTIQNYMNKQKLKHNLNKQFLTRQLELEKRRKDLVSAGAIDPRSQYHYELKDVDKELKEISALINK